MGGLPPTNKIRARAIRVGPSQRLPGCALDGMLRRALAFGSGWNHSDGQCKRFARREELEKAGADTQDKRRRREKYWRVLLALKQFPRGDPMSIGCSVWRHDEDCFIVCSPCPSSTPPTPPAASHATACAPIQCRRARRGVLHPCRIERRSPAALVVSRELKIVALARHADRDVADAGPGVEPGPQRPERAVVRRASNRGEDEQPATPVDHVLGVPNVITTQGTASRKTCRTAISFQPKGTGS
jgi:hypothetical protein